MHNPRLTTSPSPRNGFTLVELLVVIAIIGVLAGLLLPVFSSVQNKARKVQVINDIRNIKTSIVSYYGDYQKYPLTSGQIYYAQQVNGGNDTVYGDPGPNAFYSTVDLLDILCARDNSTHHYNLNNVSNPNQTIYWNGPLATSLTQPRNGISQADVAWKDHVGANYTIPKGSLMDPWGRSYVIWMDATKDGDFSAATNWAYVDLSPTPGTTPTGLPPLGIAVASMGPDGFWGSVTKLKPYGDGILAGSDDIVLWR